jgi:sugar (pentulose or hexulose) kinase
LWIEKVSALNLEISSISTDSWGVDYILYDKDGKIMKPYSIIVIAELQKVLKSQNQK